MTAPDPLAETLRWVGASATAARVRAGELSPRRAIEAALARIDASQPELNAFRLVWHERALAEADAVAARLADGEHLPLAGVPVATKDEFEMAGEVIAKGSRTRTSPATEDAEIIRLIRAAGGVIVGVTRTPEFCLTPYTESELGGITRNPWDPSRTPGGSSGGSAAAVAAGLVPMALGGDGGGSIRGPAAWCGLPGLFATPGSISTAPQTDPWTGFVSYGGLTRSIADTALLYDVLLAEPHGLSGAVGEAPAPVKIALTSDRSADQPLPQGGKVEASASRAADTTADLLRRLGHDVEPRRLKFGRAGLKFTIRYLTSARADLLASDDPAQAEPITRLVSRLGGPARRFLPFALDLTKERAALDASIGDAQVILTPTMPCTAPVAGERNGKPALFTMLAAARRVSFINTWNLFGWPGLTVPAGVDANGLPIGVLLTARPGSERLLLQLGAQLERERPWPLGPGAPVEGPPAA
ncbi:MAG: amidase [Solirubrobacteraceae bacterium]|nr:amidase [Solirubrobacteraceae bacterium]